MKKIFAILASLMLTVGSMGFMPVIAEEQENDPISVLEIEEMKAYLEAEQQKYINSPKTRDPGVNFAWSEIWKSGSIMHGKGTINTIDLFLQKPLQTNILTTLYGANNSKLCSGYAFEKNAWTASAECEKDIAGRTDKVFSVYSTYVITLGNGETKTYNTEKFLSY